MKFIADAMLGRLARWLRLMGFDTLYFADLSDGDVLRLAKREERTILTRDRGFLKRGIGACILIESDDPFEQLKQVLRKLQPELPAKMLCANCNGAIEEVARKEEVAGSVPEHVYLSHNHFLRCAACGNIYWEGSHYKNLRAKIEDISRTAKGNEG